MRLAESPGIWRLLRAVLFLAMQGSVAFAASPVVISEFLALNTHTLADEDGRYSDWVELHNTTTKPVNLDGWYLTDTTNNLAKWRFPATNILANGYLVVFASGKDRQIARSASAHELSTCGDGEYLALVMPDGVTDRH